MFIKSDKGINQNGEFDLNGESYKINKNPIIDKTYKFVEIDKVEKIDEFDNKNFKFAKIIKFKGKLYFCHIFKICNIYRIGRIYKINKNNNKIKQFAKYNK